MKHTSLLAGFIFYVSFAIGQDPLRIYDFEKLADELFPVQDLDLDYSQLYENLAQLLSNPINLNSASEDQLRSMFILNEAQIRNFIDYRNQQGNLLSVYELQIIPGFDDITLNKIIPFVTVRPDDPKLKSLLGRMLHEKNNYFITRFDQTLESKKGYEKDSLDPAYAGSSSHWYHRFRVSRPGEFSLGFTLEKDAGEAFVWNPSQQLGYDYTSVHFQLLNQGRLTNLTLGDFQAQFGQGLILGGGFGVGKGSESITTIRRSSLGFLPYTSLNENGFYRGAAATLELMKHVKLNGFISRRRVDGNLAGDSTLSTVSSLSATGLHRTASEIENRNSIVEENAGVVIAYHNGSLEGGVVFHHTQFSNPLVKSPTVYNQFSFNGDANRNAGFYFNYSRNNFTFFGEAAHTFGSGNALIAGVLGSLSPQFDWALLYRNFDRDFHTFQSNAFAENTTPQNEQGYYTGWKYKFNKKVTLTGYADLFRFPWLRYRGYSPSVGHEGLLRFTYQPGKNVLFFLQIREESKIRNVGSGNLYQTQNGIKRNYWANADYSVSPKLSFKSRVQVSTFDLQDKSTHGFALIQDFNFSLGKFTFSTRHALFDTEDFDNRQYVYERDVWLAYSFPFYDGEGIRNYVVIHYAVTRKIDLWLRWARTKYNDRSVIGSGNEKIEGNSKNDIKFQVTLRL